LQFDIIIGETDMASQFLRAVIATFRKQKQMAERAIAQLRDAQFRTALDLNTLRPCASA
jgi:hypothetical protein